MNDENTSLNTENEGLLLLQNQAEEAVSEPDLRERVRDMTAPVKSRLGSSRRWMVWTMPSAVPPRPYP